MARWEPGARERLQEAALDLYATKGFEETTVGEVAAAAGLTERTFFRHFSDKREVLFAGTPLLEQSFVERVAGAAPGASPLEIVADAVRGANDFFAESRRAHSRRRQGVIAANPELQERERNKMASFALAIAEALRARGVSEPTATLSAESGVTVFRIAFEAWVADGEERTIDEIEASLFDELRSLTRY